MPRMTEIEAERALLGSLVLCGDADEVWDHEEVEAIIGPGAFTDADHMLIYNALVRRWHGGLPIDLVTMCDELRKDSNGEPWESILVTLAESVPSSANAMTYAAMVREAWDRRRLGMLCHRVAAECEAAVDLSQLIERHSRDVAELADVGSDAGKSDVVDLITNLDESLAHIERMYLPTGIPGIDIQLNGLARGELTVLGARPSLGKTSLGLQIAYHVSHIVGVPAVVFTLEMRSLLLMIRLAASLSGMSADELRRGHLAERARQDAMFRLRDALTRERLWFIDDVSRVDRIIARAKRLVRRHGVGLIVIDYLQLCGSPGKHENRNQEIGAMLKAFKRLVVETDVAVLLLSQLTRSMDRDKRPPRLSDLRDSGAIEQDADVIAFLHKPDTATESQVNWIVAKNRNGPLSSCALSFDKACMLFVDPQGLPF